ncbi:MAG: ABC transporter ATP-binding protein, partial [Clostridia bacterium]|nr:ABC transporter ATP-binding protein [Clostridia bacterium]
MDSYLALAMIAVLPFIFITVYFISRNGVPLYTKVQEAVDKMVRIVREDTQGIRVIKALSKTEYEHERYEKANRGLSHKEQKAGIIMGSVNPIMTFLMNMGIVIVVSMSASRVAGHESSPETVIAFMQYFTQISMAMMSVTRIFVMYTKSAASAKRIAEVIETPADLTVKSER